MSEPNVSTQQDSSPGAMLSEERERQRMSLEDAAEQLNLRPSLVADLERDNYEQVPVPTYRRGYLRAYARMLGIDDRAVVAAYDRVHGRSDLDERRVEPVNTIKPPTRWGAILFRVFSLIVVVVLIGMTLLWWEGRESAPGYGDEESVGVEQGSNPSVTSDSDLPPLPESGNIANNATSNDTTDMSTQTPAASPGEQTFIVNTGPAEQVVSDAAEPAPGQLQVDTPEGRNGATGGLVDDGSGDGDQQGDGEAANVPALAMTFNGQSWVDVRDANGTTVLRGLQQGGTSATIEGTPPFTLTVGNASQVALEYRGESVDLSQYTGGNNVARFTLGE
ncbi:RodZ domain-containing protein [Kushneria aurantia]|uniref:RodZ domain-containing protein n=1 Tax=Kushneria aurantia TaxID=504092 RepID=A0ABV6G8B8_9GAMM|nr:RodZ family helix-turn-helix domain-containing protein [Kushneria aurantia]